MTTSKNPQKQIVYDPSNTTTFLFLNSYTFRPFSLPTGLQYSILKLVVRRYVNNQHYHSTLHTNENFTKEPRNNQIYSNEAVQGKVR